MRKTRIAVLTGGDSVESPSSYDSARDVIKHLNRNRYDLFVVDVANDGWWVKNALDEEAIGKIDKATFTFMLNGERTGFDCVFIIMHGGAGENGTIQGYFEQLKLPYTGSGVLTSALCTDKYKCKQFLASTTGIALPKGLLVNELNLTHGLQRAPIPCIVKPNGSGSSFGVSKVGNHADLKNSIELAMQFDHEVLLEEAISGVEVTIGIMITKNGEEYILPITETRFKGEVFDTSSKLVQENTQLITPAPLPEQQAQRCRKAALEVYKALDCRGLVRIDFIIMNGVPYFLEVNTIPGMMLKSSIPRQIQQSGIGLERFYDLVIEDAMTDITKRVAV